DKGLYDDINDYGWSPDSHWVTYAKTSDNRNHVVYLYSADTGKSMPVTTSANSPDVLCPPPPGNQKPTGQPPQAPKPKTKPPAASQPQTGPSEEKTRAEIAAAEQKPGTRAPLKNFRVDLEGIQNRIVALPIPPGNVQNLAAAKGLVFYVVSPL